MTSSHYSMSDRSGPMGGRDFNYSRRSQGYPNYDLVGDNLEGDDYQRPHGDRDGEAFGLGRARGREAEEGGRNEREEEALGYRDLREEEASGYRDGRDEEALGGRSFNGYRQRRGPRGIPPMDYPGYDTDRGYLDNRGGPGIDYPAYPRYRTEEAIRGNRGGPGIGYYAYPPYPTEEAIRGNRGGPSIGYYAYPRYPNERALQDPGMYMGLPRDGRRRSGSVDTRASREGRAPRSEYAEDIMGFGGARNYGFGGVMQDQNPCSGGRSMNNGDRFTGIPTMAQYDRYEPSMVQDDPFTGGQGDRQARPRRRDSRESRDGGRGRQDSRESRGGGRGRQDSRDSRGRGRRDSRESRYA